MNRVWVITNNHDPEFIFVVEGSAKPFQVCTFIYRTHEHLSDESILLARYDPNRVTVRTQSHGTYTAIPMEVHDVKTDSGKFQSAKEADST